MNALKELCNRRFSVTINRGQDKYYCGLLRTPYYNWCSEGFATPQLAINSAWKHVRDEEEAFKLFQNEDE